MPDISVTERLSIVETRLGYIEESTKKTEEHAQKTEEDVKEIKEKLNEFISTASRTYATRKEVCDVKLEVLGQIKDHKENSKSWIQSAVPWVFALINLIIVIVVTWGPK